MSNQFTFTRATRQGVKLLIGLIGPSGGGKTFTAMRLATGLSEGKPFAVIDTESERAKHYAGQFAFDHCDMKPPFRPSSYAEAIHAAVDAGYGVIVVDSFSHEHAGEGGLLDWHEEELQRMAGDNWQKREAVKMAAWIKPKMAHKQMIQQLLQVKAHLILCFRAEEKVKMEKGENNRTVIVPLGWTPICEKNIPYELTASFLLTPDAPGVPKPLKLQAEHKPLFPLDKPITEESGKRIAEWADGGTPATPQAPKPASVTKEQIRLKTELWKLTSDKHGGDVAAFKQYLWDEGFVDDTEDPSELPVDRLTAVIAAVRRKLEALI